MKLKIYMNKTIKSFYLTNKIKLLFKKTQIKMQILFLLNIYLMLVKVLRFNVTMNFAFS